MKSIYIETSIPSYLTARPSSDVRAAAWQQITYQWWDEERKKYDLFISELVITEASEGHPEAARRRLKSLENIAELAIDQEMSDLATALMAGGGIPRASEADALHIAIAAIQRINYLLTWNCRHINNASAKPIIRKLCEKAGYVCPEICTPLELLSEDSDYV
ncbi:MAG: type II toxin-antitoxin system VapC family toxin [Pseudomonadales bacterium]